jgi:hypothetical protein
LFTMLLNPSELLRSAFGCGFVICYCTTPLALEATPLALEGK